MSLLETFLPDAAERIQRLRDGLAEAAAPADLIRDAHTLTGSAATVGLLRASALAAELESALERGDVDAARTALEALAKELDRARAGVHTVLCIEDDPTSLLLVERTAARIPGVRLLSARTGSDGLETARRERPDLVLLDAVLPDLSAEDVLRDLADDPGVPVAVVSANARAERIAELRGAGAVQYLTKPLDVGRLAALLRGEP
jgi:CheY-like chemotaxis protein